MAAPKASAKAGQLVWCPADPSLGVGTIKAVEDRTIVVIFPRLEEERRYTTSAENGLERYLIDRGQSVQTQSGTPITVRPLGIDDNLGVMIYEGSDGERYLEAELVVGAQYEIGAKARLASLHVVHPEAVRARLMGLDLASLGSREGYAGIFGARVAWLPHQIDVATRALEREPVRMLLADEVGLGKTVEALLIYAGLRRENRAQRVLILAPETLCIQWLGEVYRKVHELPVLLDDERLDDASVDFPDLSPFDAYPHLVASIDRVSRDPKLLEAARQSTWDLVIIDEAHHLNRGDGVRSTAGYRLAEILAPRTKHLLLLTATPMALNPENYHALLRLLDPVRFDAPERFARVVEQSQALRLLAKAVQGANQQGKVLNESMIALGLDLLGDTAHDAQIFQEFVAESSDDVAYQQVIQALRQRHGLAEVVVRNRRGPVGGMPKRLPELHKIEPSEQQALLLEVGEEVLTAVVAGHPDESERRRFIGQLLRGLWATPKALDDILRPISPELADELAPHIDAIVQAPTCSKGLPTGDMRLRWLAQTLREKPMEKFLVFVESPTAVRVLKPALEVALGSDVAVFHRGLSPRDQDRQVAWFRDPKGPRVMLSTEAGGEGRNFQFCSNIVLYDLPWRPAMVEQRIGRVDRVGQHNDVRVLVPYFEGGFEAGIVHIMHKAIGVLERTVGGIDHALEYVGDRIADLILDDAEHEAWRTLAAETENIVQTARERIENAVDPIVDTASFSMERAQAVLSSIPADLEARTEALVQRYADTHHIELHPKGLPGLIAAEGAPAVGSAPKEAVIGTFSRTLALDHEEVEFFSFGHPLVDHALEWAEESQDASASLAILRGAEKDGAVFIWAYVLSVPENARPFLSGNVRVLALDESGQRTPAYEHIALDGEIQLERMDAAPLKPHQARWRASIEKNFDAVLRLAEPDVQRRISEARKRWQAVMEQRHADLERSFLREIDGGVSADEARERFDTAKSMLANEEHRVEIALDAVQPKWVAAIALRLVPHRAVSA